jgi:chromosome segregation ATPase
MTWNLLMGAALDQTVEDIKADKDDSIDHVDVMAAVAKGKRWFVRDNICAAAAYFLKKFRDMRRALEKQGQQFHKINAELKKAKDDIVQYQTKVTEVTERFKQLDKRVDTVKQEALAQVNQLSEENNILERNCDNLSTALNKARADLCAAHQKIADKDNAIDQQTKIAMTWRSQAGNLEKELKDERNNSNALSSRLDEQSLELVRVYHCARNILKCDRQDA